MTGIFKKILIWSVFLLLPIAAGAIMPYYENEMVERCKNVDENNVEQSEACFDYYSRIDEAQKACAAIDKSDIKQRGECYAFYGLTENEVLKYQRDNNNIAPESSFAFVKKIIIAAGPFSVFFLLGVILVLRKLVMKVYKGIYQ